MKMEPINGIKVKTREKEGRSGQQSNNNDHRVYIKTQDLRFSERRAHRFISNSKEEGGKKEGTK